MKYIVVSSVNHINTLTIHLDLNLVMEDLTTHMSKYEKDCENKQKISSPLLEEVRSNKPISGQADITISGSIQPKDIKKKESICLICHRGERTGIHYVGAQGNYMCHRCESYSLNEDDDSDSGRYFHKLEKEEYDE